jgi:hypothetical protein
MKYKEKKRETEIEREGENRKHDPSISARRTKAFEI